MTEVATAYIPKGSQALSDFELVKKSLAGDESSFEHLFRVHSPWVKGLCMKKGLNFMEADDLCQEIFLKTYQKLSGFRGDSAFTTWLYRTAINQTLMHFRNGYTKRFQPVDPVDLQKLAGRTEDRNLSTIPISLDINKALAALAPGYRTVLVLHDVEGFEHEEIAEILNCSPGTSKSQLSRARDKFASLLGLKRTTLLPAQYCAITDAHIRSWKASRLETLTEQLGDGRHKEIGLCYYLQKPPLTYEEITTKLGYAHLRSTTRAISYVRKKLLFLNKKLA
jgi:RNA polymerase sigma-70 factor, ECF subfamily